MSDHLDKSLIDVYIQEEVIDDIIFGYWQVNVIHKIRIQKIFSQNNAS